MSLFQPIVIIIIIIILHKICALLDRLINYFIALFSSPYMQNTSAVFNNLFQHILKGLSTLHLTASTCSNDHIIQHESVLEEKTVSQTSKPQKVLVSVLVI